MEYVISLIKEDEFGHLKLCDFEILDLDILEVKTAKHIL